MKEVKAIQTPDDITTESGVYYFFGNCCAVNIVADGKDETLLLGVEDGFSGGRFIYAFRVLTGSDRVDGENEVCMLDLALGLPEDKILKMAEFSNMLSQMWGDEISFNPLSELNENRTWPFVEPKEPIMTKEQLVMELLLKGCGLSQTEEQEVMGEITVTKNGKEKVLDLFDVGYTKSQLNDELSYIH